MEEVINIGPSNPEPISLDLKKQDDTPTVNFGSGIELLMNDKKKTTALLSLSSILNLLLPESQPYKNLYSLKISITGNKYD